MGKGSRVNLPKLQTLKPPMLHRRKGRRKEGKLGREETREILVCVEGLH